MPTVAGTVPKAGRIQAHTFAVVGQVDIINQAQIGRRATLSATAVRSSRCQAGCVPGQADAAHQIRMGIKAAVQEGDGDAGAGKAGIVGQALRLAEHRLFGRVIIGKGRGRIGRGMQRCRRCVAGQTAAQSGAAAGWDRCRRPASSWVTSWLPDALTAGDQVCSCSASNAWIGRCTADGTGRQCHSACALRFTSSQSTPKPKPGAPLSGLRNSRVRSNSWRSSNVASVTQARVSTRRRHDRWRPAADCADAASSRRVVRRVSIM